MAGGSSPSKEDIDAIFHRLRSQATNKSCFDCGAKNPTWSSVTYGVFICIDCSAVHRNLGVHLTFVRSTNLDTNWTWLQIRQMQVGGNANASQFFRQHNCNTTDAQQKYNSRAAQLYKDKLLNKAQQSLQLYGTTIPKLASLSATVDPSAGPRVDFLTSEVPIEPVKSTIGVRKIQPKKGGLGAKKGGLGATRVKTNFAEIEERANMADKLKLAPAPEKIITEEEKAETLASVRLAYQDLSIKQHKEEEKLKAIDPNKAKQIERLGMGFGRASGVSHSALTDMKTLTQEETTRSGAPVTKPYDRDDSSSGGGGGGGGVGGGNNSGNGGNDFFDDYSIIYGFSGSGKGADMSEATQMGFDTLEPIDSKRPTVKTMFSPAGGGSLKGGATSISDQPTYSRAGGNSSSSSSNNSSNRRNGSHQSQPVDNSDAAQKKFGSAKGISSDQFFGDEQSGYDRSSNLSKFQGSTSISSADYFGHGSSSMGSGGGAGRSGGSRGPALQYNGPDLEDVRESVRQGVTKVAGRISSLASDVMNSIQDKYGY
ncbi:ADP-ribosylation factor GTPase-activating protein 2 isoform X2 [Anopheles funestus]|uniref:ADP-ribosylation factor GTPase-activating protein 2 isoform X2 n=1 Tax=Anopheles funestus TaxID=62324 RepID=UPI0020C63D76|nr:ADP-ribosylation factor GTPase-activating protein 2 isoform X2 [Anopheles funestus]